MTPGRRGLLTGASAIAALAVMPRVRAIQPARPNQHLTVLLGLRAGSVLDTAARRFFNVLAPRLPGTGIALTNLPGDGGRTMLAALGGAAADGSVAGWVMTPTLPARMIDHEEPALGQSIRLLGQIAREPVVFVSPSSDPATAIQDVIQRAANDADAVPLGTPPGGSPPHLAALRLQGLAQTQLNIVTFPSSAAALRAVLDGNVSAAALGLADAIGPLRDGSLGAIGIAARRRFGSLPDTPVLDEGGIPLSAFVRCGVAVPVDTPAEVAAPLIAALKAAAIDDAFRQQAEASGFYAAWADGADWTRQMQAEQTMLTALWHSNPWLSSSGG